MEPQTTKLGRLIDAEHAARGESALRLLFSGTEAFAAHLKSSLETPYINALSEKVLRWAGADPRANWVFATTRVLADSPGKAMSAEHERLIDQIAKVLPAAQSEVLIVSPYFVLSDDGVKALGDIASRAVTVKVLTNSLASNDVSAAHSGYSKTRIPLTERGVRLYELKRVGAPVAKDEERAFSSAAASLHAKSFLVDRRQVFIGSLNLDPRSIVIDTEVGVLIDSTSLAEQWVQMFDVVTNPALAYEVTLQGEGRSAYPAWKTTAADGALVTIYKESDTTWWQRFKVGFLKMVPFVDSQL